MKNKKTLFILAAVLFAVAVGFVLYAVLVGFEKTPAAETSAVATKASSTATWAGKAAEKTTAATTKQAAIKTASTEQTLDIATEDECRSMGIGGGQFYYAIGYKNGDDAMQSLVSKAIGAMVENHTLVTLADTWFAKTVFPRDTGRDPMGAADSALLQKLQENGVTVGVIDGNSPVAYFENGQAKGYEIDVATAVFAYYKVTPRFVSVTADTAAEQLKNGAVDLVWGGLRDGAVKGISYSEANEWNLENELCYFTYTKKRYKGETDLLAQEGKMGVISGTLCEDFIKDRLKTAGYDTEITVFANENDAFAALKKGDVFCVACDYLSVYAMWKNG